MNKLSNNVKRYLLEFIPFEEHFTVMKINKVFFTLITNSKLFVNFSNFINDTNLYKHDPDFINNPT